MECPELNELMTPNLKRLPEHLPKKIICKPLKGLNGSKTGQIEVLNLACFRSIQFLVPSHVESDIIEV